MSNPYPLQPGDRAPNYSGRDASQAGDQRPENQWDPNRADEGHGRNAAPQFEEPNSSPLWKVGQLAPNAFLTAPYPHMDTEGDTSGAGTEVHEINTRQYGEDYDSTAPVRSRDVTAIWKMDTDNDGDPN